MAGLVLMQVAEGFYSDLWNVSCDRELLPQDSRAFIDFFLYTAFKVLMDEKYYGSAKD